MIALTGPEARQALTRLSSRLTKDLTEARGIEREAQRAYDLTGDLTDLQDLRTAEGITAGLTQARNLLDTTVREARPCPYCGGPDDHGIDCLPASRGGTQPDVRRIP
jgi:hypothetical protein